MANLVLLLRKWLGHHKLGEMCDKYKIVNFVRHFHKNKLYLQDDVPNSHVGRLKFQIEEEGSQIDAIRKEKLHNHGPAENIKQKVMKTVTSIKDAPKKEVKRAKDIIDQEVHTLENKLEEVDAALSEVSDNSIEYHQETKNIKK